MSSPSGQPKKPTGKDATTAPPSKTQAIKKDLDDVTDIMKKNVEKVMSNMDTLEDVEWKTMEMRENASRFKNASRKVNVMMCLQNYKLLALIILIVIIVLAVIIIPIAIHFSN